jgi:hypothetical protein
MASHPDPNATKPSRRALISAMIPMAAVGCASPLSIGSAFAQQHQPSPTDVAKVVVWIVGGRLGLAALVYFRNTGDYKKFFDEAKSRAKEIDLDIPDFPPRPAKSTDGLLAMLEYFSKGDGARLGQQVAKKYGVYHATLYDVSSRLFHVPLIYDLDPALARDKLVEGMRRNLVRINMPEKLWKPLVQAVADKKSFEDVRAAVIQMNSDVLDYLVAVARGQQQ